MPNVILVTVLGAICANGQGSRPPPAPIAATGNFLGPIRNNDLNTIRSQLRRHALVKATDARGNRADVRRFVRGSYLRETLACPLGCITPQPLLWLSFSVSGRIAPVKRRSIRQLFGGVVAMSYIRSVPDCSHVTRHPLAERAQDTDWRRPDR